MCKLEEVVTGFTILPEVCSHWFLCPKDTRGDTQGVSSAQALLRWLRIPTAHEWRSEDTPNISATRTVLMPAPVGKTRRGNSPDDVASPDGHSNPHHSVEATWHLIHHDRRPHT